MDMEVAAMKDAATTTTAASQNNGGGPEDHLSLVIQKDYGSTKIALNADRRVTAGKVARCARKCLRRTTRSSQWFIKVPSMRHARREY